MYRCWKYHFPVSSITMNTFFFLNCGSVILLVVSQPTYYWTVGWLQNYMRQGNKQSWSKWDILLAFGCMDTGKLQKVRMCGIMVKIENRYFWIQVTSITVQDVTPCCTVSEPGPWRWRYLVLHNNQNYLPHDIASPPRRLAYAEVVLPKPTGFTLIHTATLWNKIVTTVLEMLWYFICQWLSWLYRWLPDYRVRIRKHESKLGR